MVKMNFSPSLLLGKRQYMYLVFKASLKIMLSTVHSWSRAAILFSQLANITSMTIITSTNDVKNMFLEILLAPNIVNSKDNEIAWKYSQD